MAAFLWQQKLCKSFPVPQRIRWNEMICLNEMSIMVSLDKKPFSLWKAASAVPSLILSLRVQIYTCCSVWFKPGGFQAGRDVLTNLELVPAHLETCLSSAHSPTATLLIYTHFEGNSWLIYQPIPCPSPKFNPKAAQFQQSCQYNVPCSAALLTFFDIMGSSLICNETLWINQCVLIHEVFFLLRSPQESNSLPFWKSLWKPLRHLLYNKRKMLHFEEKEISSV